MRRRNIPIPKEELYRKYWVEQRLPASIAKDYDCGRGVIFNRLKKFSIPLRGNSETHKLLVGKKSPRYSGGRKSGNCINCDKKLKNSYAMRCHSCEMINRWKDLNYKQKVLAKVISKSRPFNSKERKLFGILNDLFSNEYKFVGNGKFWIERYNPDFVNVNGQKKIIELYGDYWHNLPSYKKRDKQRLYVYKKYGYKTLIIWEHELKEINNLKKKILKFNNFIGVN